LQEEVEEGGKPGEVARDELRRWEWVLGWFRERTGRFAGDRLFPKGIRYGDESTRFWRAWAALTKIERVTLVQVTQEGIVNPRRRTVVRPLIAAGWLRYDGMLFLRDERWRERVLRAESTRLVRDWERSDATAVVWMAQVFGLVCLVATLGVIARAYPDANAVVAGGVASLVAVAGPALPLIGKVATRLVVALNSEERTASRV
jgi:hypothetical protein